jgi:hypothetical protein
MNTFYCVEILSLVTKDEYLLLCRNIVISYILSEQDCQLFTEILYKQNFNPMWRPREAVTLGLQRTLVKRPDFVLNLRNGTLQVNPSYFGTL